MHDGRLTRIDESNLLREIQSAYESLCPQFDAAEALVGPMRIAMEEIYKRSLKHPLPANTYAARF